MKICKGCKSRKANTEFYEKPNNKDGLEAKCKPCCRARRAAWGRTPRGLEYKRVEGRKQRKALMGKIFDLLGRECVFCGEEYQRALQIDHINNDGAEARARGGNPYKRMYKDMLTDPDAKEKFRILCVKCNWLRRYESDEEIIERYGNKK